jgi:hypothetical protein
MLSWNILLTDRPYFIETNADEPCGMDLTVLEMDSLHTAVSVAEFVTARVQARSIPLNGRSRASKAQEFAVPAVSVVLYDGPRFESSAYRCVDVLIESG